MKQEELRQRIHYLVQHGGLYPSEKGPISQRITAWLVGVVLICTVVELILLLR